MAEMAEDVYCTLLVSDSYLPGAAVLAHSLRDCGTKKKIACLVTIDSLLYNTIAQLKTLFDYVIPVDKIANPNIENLVRLERLDLRFAFTKIALWQQTQFRKIVYVDADVVALRAPDELFDVEEPFAAVPDIGWPDCFNSGVMLLLPNAGDYRSLQTLAASGTSFDGADQGLLNEYFGNRPWHRLSFTYNCTPSSSYQYEPAFRHFRSSIKMAHFIGREKPWTLGREALSAAPSAVFRELLGHWFSVYDRHYPSSHDGVTQEQRHMQLFVRGEQQPPAHAAVPQHAVLPTAIPRPAESHATKTEMPMTAPDDHIEVMSQMGPAHTAFQPPQNMWDATREAPPTASRPEAQSFPTQHYTMSQDTHLYEPDASYFRPEKLDPIFPWEKTAQKPTRVFAEPRIKTPPQPSETVVGLGGSSNVTASPSAALGNLAPGSSQPAESIKISNAWDADSSIDAYVRAVRSAQRGQHSRQTSTEGDFAKSDIKPRLKKPGSLILTDFPSADERPSLPVTPAPIQRPTFWGDEQETSKTLPSAAGVPEQKDWDPTERLEELRRNSLITAAELPNVEQINANLPRREVVGSSLGGGEAQVGVPSLEAQGVVLGTEPGEAVMVRESTELGSGLIAGGLSVGSFGNTGFPEGVSSSTTVTSSTVRRSESSETG